MSPATSSPVPVALGSATSDTEEGRAFFQSRLRLFAGWMCLFSLGFYTLNFALNSLHALGYGLGYAMAPPVLWHLAGTIVLGTVWLMTGARALSSTRLLWTESAGLVLTCVCFALMGALMAIGNQAISPDPVRGLMIAQLAVTSTVLTRAVAVPSTPTRTLWLGIAALTPQMVLAGYVTFSGRLAFPAGMESFSYTTLALSEHLNVVAWNVSTVLISTVGSRVIFGLRAEADKIRRLGQYTLEEKIGEGGMGTVYRASHAMLRRPTAIKLLPPDRAGEQSIRRFEREVQLTAKLSHPSTVAVFDYGRTPTGVFYYAMEYLDGLNLEQLVERDGPQDPGRVWHILAQVCGALAEAHDVGLIHRDIKPANIILCERGGIPDVAKVVDFGLVKATVPSEGDATMLVTGRHVLTGTPMYMAPEAIRGEEYVDGRSDLYALGAVGYFLLTGRTVFESDNLVEIVAHHLHTVPIPPSTQYDVVVPAALEAILMRVLAKAPEDRFATAREMARALEACAGDAPWSSERASRWWAARTGAEHSPGGSTHTSGAPTLAVDLAERMPTAR